VEHLYLLLIVFLSTGLCAQTIKYTYDTAGNRNSRTYVVNLRRVTADITPQDSVEVEAPLGQLSVTVYPNPTKGDLVVAVTGLKEEETIQFLLFDPQGHQLLRLQGQSGSTRINLSAYPSGWYMLQVIKKDERVEFKIIKQ